jgi:hypothetical protein
MVRADAFDPTESRHGLQEVEVHRPTGQLVLAHPFLETFIMSAADAPMHVEKCAKTQEIAAKDAAKAGGAEEGEGATEWTLKVVPYCGKKYL